MRTTRNISITMPPTLLRHAQKLARKESRTMSELLREALRRYMREQVWEELNAYGRARAKELGITEEDVVPLVRQCRREQNEKSASGQPVK